MFISHVEQADKGCDFDFLKGGSGSSISRDLH
jgi:L-arabonate dehydrase